MHIILCEGFCWVGIIMGSDPGQGTGQTLCLDDLVSAQYHLVELGASFSLYIIGEESEAQSWYLVQALSARSRVDDCAPEPVLTGMT